MKTLFLANVFAVVTAATSVGLTLNSSSAFAADPAATEMPQLAHRGDGPHGRGSMHEGHGRRGMERLFRAVGASEEQKTKIRAIFDKARTDIKPDPQARQAQRQKMMDLMAAPTIDRAAIEQLRAGRLADHERVSKRMTQAMTDAAEVLTPEQRTKLAATMKQRQGRMHGERRGEGHGEHMMMPPAKG